MNNKMEMIYYILSFTFI